MRLWSLHPRYLDARGLVALWREALLAQAVLRNRTKGYRRHPQLDRFRAHPDPLAAIAVYLRAVHAESAARGYHFNGARIGSTRTRKRIPCTSGQLAYEREHLKRKLRLRDAGAYRRLLRHRVPDAHPLFTVVAGRREPWEKPREA